MAYSQRQSILNLIYKKNDPQELSNYRPISLLNTDYKILSYSLANRVKKVISAIINHDQTGYIKNRQVYFNLRQIQDIIDYADKFKVEGAILFLDFSKAFDTLDWNFLLNSLKHFGFNHSFIKWIKTLYNNISSLIINNGWISSPVILQRGIRQGCPCSSLLFIIAVEIMANNLRTSKKIKGIEIKLDNKTHHLKISQLADDTTLFLKSKNEIKEALNIIEIFGSFSGLKLNRNKTEGIWIGKLKNSRDKVDDINFTNNPVKVLGLYVGINKTECEQLNWNSRLDKILQLIKTWEKRNLTIIGKIMIIKTLLIPQLTYLGNVMFFNKKQMKELEHIIFSFLWNNKPDKVKRTTMIANYEKGGLNMLDIPSYFKMLKIKWVTFLINAKDENWSIIPKLYFNKFGQNFLIFKTNLFPCNYKLLENLPDFYREIVMCWQEIKGGKREYPQNFRNIRNQILWGNRYIQFDNKPLFFKNWIDSGLIFVNDIIDRNGKLSETHIFHKLKVKENWISEYFKLKLAIPKTWIDEISSTSSLRTQITTNFEQFYVDNKPIQLHDLNNKTVYQLLKSSRIEENIGFEKWKRFFLILGQYLKKTF